MTNTKPAPRKPAARKPAKRKGRRSSFWNPTVATRRGCRSGFFKHALAASVFLLIWIGGHNQLADEFWFLMFCYVANILWGAIDLIRWRKWLA